MDLSDVRVILSLGIPLLFCVLLVFFVYQTTRRERKVPFLIVSICFGVVQGIFGLAGEEELFLLSHALILALQLGCSGMQVFFFFLFLENLRDLKFNPYRLVLACCLAFLQQFSLWLIVWFSDVAGDSVAVSIMWHFADIGYNYLALFVFLGCGVVVHVQTYRLISEKKALALALALVSVSAGFVISAIIDVLEDLKIKFDWDLPISLGNFGEIFQLLGLALYTIVYLTNVDYLYRLPYDNYSLMISYKKSGVLVHYVKFKCRSKFEINQDLFSGLLSTINSVFQAILTKDVDINTISSKHATVLMESGDHVTAAVITEKPTAMLDKALKRYVRLFERMFIIRLGDQDTCTNDFDRARVLLKKIFPFCIVEDMEGANEKKKN